ncbi:hypothetical protein, partial [Escherichia coli]|uniref:hypothetical protein n=1 Tax=Escherichia coli TaxID=562 RepID=UPI001BE9C104
PDPGNSRRNCGDLSRSDVIIIPTTAGELSAAFSTISKLAFVEIVSLSCYTLSQSCAFLR